MIACVFYNNCTLLWTCCSRIYGSLQILVIMTHSFLWQLQWRWSPAPQSSPSDVASTSSPLSATSPSRSVTRTVPCHGLAWCAGTSARCWRTTTAWRSICWHAVATSAVSTSSSVGMSSSECHCTNLSTNSISFSRYSSIHDWSFWGLTKLHNQFCGTYNSPNTNTLVWCTI